MAIEKAYTYYVYIIKKEGKILYVGHTKNVEKRHIQHKAKYGKKISIEIIQTFSDKKSALIKEYTLIKEYLSSGLLLKNKHGGSRPGCGRKKMKKMDKKVRVSVFIPAKDIKANGGENAVKDLIISKLINIKNKS